MSTLQPIEIRAVKGEDIMHIVWSDTHVGVYPHLILRGYCPCATCQGHGQGVRYVPSGNTELMDLEMVGNYAIQLSWADGHSTGIYSFRYLRDLCTCGVCGPLDGRAITR